MYLTSTSSAKFENFNQFENNNFYPHPYQNKKRQVSDWRTRLLCEYAFAPQSFNVRLSFSDDNLPEKLDELPHIVSNFMKRVRRHFSYHYNNSVKIKYFVISEFGERNTCRLHLHMMMFVYGGVDFWRFSEVIEKKWYCGQTHVRSMCGRHCFYNTKYFLKKLFENTYKSQSNGIGFDYVKQILPYCLANNFMFYVCGYRRRMTRAQKQKLLKPDDLVKLRNDYVNQTIQYFKDKSLFTDVYMTRDALIRSHDFLCRMFLFNDWPLDFRLNQQTYKVLLTDVKTSIVTLPNGRRTSIKHPYLCVRWFGAFALYFAHLITARVDYSKELVNYLNTV